MAKMITIQSNFTAGELDDRVLSRVDFEGYLKGLKKARNVLIIPQGAFIRRFGLSYKLEITGITNSDQANITLFELNAETYYLVVFKLGTIDIYLIESDFTLTFEQQLTSLPWVADEIKTLKFAKDIDSLIVLQQNHEPQVITKSGGTWSYEGIGFKDVPSYDFDGGYDTISFTPSAKTGGVTITASAPIFSTSFINGLFVGNGGVVKLTGFTSSTSMTGTTTADFLDLLVINGTDAFLGEPAFGATRGYPAMGVFFGGRLFLAATAQLKQGIFGSEVDDFRDFDVSTTDDDAGITVFIRGNHKIEHLVASKSLVAFTHRGVFSTGVLIDEPLTPTNIEFKSQMEGGASGLIPKVQDNQIIFGRKGGKNIFSLAYDVQRGSYDYQDVSILSAHLIRDPVDSAAFQNHDIDDGSYLFYVNSDGTLAVFQTMQNQNVSAWTLSNTNGLFKQISSIDNVGYALIQREINSVTKFYIENIDFNSLLDSSKKYSFGVKTTTITGLEHLIGKTVYITADGKAQASRVVNASGIIELESGALEVEVGLKVEPKVQTLPVNIQMQNGNYKYRNKKIQTMYIDYYNTVGVYINGQIVPFLKADTSKYGEITPQTGFSEVSHLNGWDPEESITITQDEAYPMTIRAISFEVEF